jgi:hypothetical protein
VILLPKKKVIKEAESEEEEDETTTVITPDVGIDHDDNAYYIDVELQGWLRNMLSFPSENKACV